jgi:serine/threonine-protein kinase
VYDPGNPRRARLDRIGRYEIRAKIGQGAMGEVYRAHDPVLNREVAIKTISAGRGEDETLRRRFQREAQSAARLSHPNIVTVFELGEQGDQLFMAMELLEGLDLKQAIQQARLTLPQKLDVMEQICEGLAFAHAHQIVHRDLKPANVHLAPSGKVKIMDFGLARMSGSDMTRTGLVMGTPHYMSPEQVRGLKADARSDVFSLGCVFYEMMTGRRPFEADTMHAVLFKVMQEEPPSARGLAPAAPPALVQVVERALAKDPAERFADAGEMLAVLRRVRQAIASGRGDRLLPELARPSASSRTSASGAAASRSLASGSGSGSGADAGRRSLLPWLLGGLGVAVALGVLVLRGRATAPPPPAVTGEVQSLARELIETQVERARRRLEDGDHAEAARQAELVLKLDPRNAEAETILSQARAVTARVDAAAADARLAAESGDPGRLADAAWALMGADPSHALVGELAPRLGAGFRPRAEEARRAMTEARRAAEAARASRLPVFEDALALARQGEEALAAARPGPAAQRFLEARERFERARRLAR